MTLQQDSDEVQFSRCQGRAPTSSLCYSFVGLLPSSVWMKGALI